MITRKFNRPRVGMIIFSEDRGLMARVTGVSPESYDIEVANGLWNGTVRNGILEVQHPFPRNGGADDSLGPVDFRQVLSVTADEHSRWYMGNISGASSLVDRGDPGVVTAGEEIDAAIETEGDADHVCQATIVLTVMGQSEGPQDFESWILGMDLERLAREMDEGELIGASRMIGVEVVPPGQLRHRLEAIGNDGSFFEDVPPADLPEDVAGKIEDLRGAQGWSDASMIALASEFLRENGLQGEFLRHLEAQARLENDMTEGPECL